ncbi:hypothetical protein A2U01_0108167, partial [Trifolium medium]|nr:hypothetical protein [Trifolium medium]
ARNFFGLFDQLFVFFVELLLLFVLFLGVTAPGPPSSHLVWGADVLSWASSMSWELCQ